MREFTITKPDLALNANCGIEALIAALPLRAPPLCPEISLHLADDFDLLWDQLHHAGLEASAAPPYWARAWAAGQALARYLLDHPSIVKGKTVLDLGAGSGICALAARLSGASAATACDSDPIARSAIALNSRANTLAVRVVASHEAPEAQGCGVVVAADIWYERFSSAALTAWLRTQACHGARVLLGDSGRAFFPRSGLSLMGRYQVAIRAPDGAIEAPSVFDLAP